MKKNVLLITALCLTIAVLIAVLMIVVIPIFSQEPSQEQFRELVVTGTGKVKIEPDIARVNIGVRSEASNAAEALANNNRQIKAVIQSITALGIDAADIQTRDFSIYAYENWGFSGVMSEEEPPTTYAVENTVAVVVRDLDSLGDVLSAVVEQGANTIYGITFDIANREEALEEARGLAIEDAQRSGQAIAVDAGVSLGEIQNISLYENSNMGYEREEMAMEMAAGMGGGTAVPIESGNLTIWVSADLTYNFK